MLKLLLLTLVFFSFFLANVYGQDSTLVNTEIVLLDSLIQSAQENIKNLTQLKEMITAYQVEQVKYMKNPSDNEALYKMIKLAHAILENIKSSQLTLLFEPTFLSELTIISKPVAKLGIPKP
jgi:hypothetical protein